MDYSKALLIVFIALLVVVFINAAIYYSLSKKNSIGEIELLRKAANRAKDPWEVENTNLTELSSLVKQLNVNRSDTQNSSKQMDDHDD